jgi:hypothetical protein
LTTFDALAEAAEEEALAESAAEPLVETAKEVLALAENTALALADADTATETLALADTDRLVLADTLPDCELEAAGIVSVCFVAKTSWVATCLLAPTVVVSALTVVVPTAAPPNKPANVAIPATSQRLPDL